MTCGETKVPLFKNKNLCSGSLAVRVACNLMLVFLPQHISELPDYMTFATEMLSNLMQREHIVFFI